MDKDFHTELDACRPGSNDLDQPEFAEFARALGSTSGEELSQIQQRILQWDNAIGRAMEQVEVPQEVSERILARLQIAPVPSRLSNSIAAALDGASPMESSATLANVTSSEQESVASPAACFAWRVGFGRSRSPEFTTIEPGGQRRRLLNGTTFSLATVAMLLLVGGVWLQMTATLPFGVLVDRWQGRLSDGWQPVAQAPADFPLPEAMRVFPSRWQWISRHSRNPVVAYQLTHGQAGQAMLYVAKMSRPELRTSPPLAPQPGSVGQALGCWRSKDMVYVLVVPDNRRYQAFARPSTAPLARLRGRSELPLVLPAMRICPVTRKIA